MPPLVVILHLLLSVACFVLVRRLAHRSIKVGGSVGVAALLIVLCGFAIERQPAWAWNAMRLSSPDLVFFLNLSLEGVAVLLALLWHSATIKSNDKTAPLRAALLSIPLLGAALWSYAWYFAPLPPDLNGRSNKQGLVLQTSNDSCSAAAAAMLLGFHGIVATEEEMARLSLTRDGQGTPPLGLFRGLHLKAREKQLRPQLRQLAGPAEFHRLDKPCIIGVGLRGDTPVDIQREMEVYGWQRDQRHTLLVLKSDPKGKWIDVFDPSNGRERWPARDLQYLWNGQALILAP